jgi:nitrite reductase (NO-forming)
MTTPRGSGTLPVLDVEPARRGPDRRGDRQLTFAGLGVAIAFLAVALASLVLPPGVRLGWWLPLHLALAGAAGIAAMVPFFVAALAVGPPAPVAVRGASILLVASGAVAGVVGRSASGGGLSPVAAAGAAAYVAGIAAVAWSAWFSLRHAEGQRRRATELAYGVALLDVAVGVGLVGLHLAGDPSVATHWAALRVVHAWLNVLGFVTLTVAGTLAHFVPTVVGARIGRRPFGTIAVTLLAVAAPVSAVGYALGSGGSLRVPGGSQPVSGDPLVAGGTLAAIAGAVALLGHGLHAFRDRHQWTTDHGWHRFTAGSLVVAPAWLLVAVAVLGFSIAGLGSDPAGWRLDLVLAPLVLGFVVQVLLGSLAHLLPAVGPGAPAAHAAQRALLGRGAGKRLWAWNVGVAALALAPLVPAVPGVVTALAAAIAAASGGATLVLLGLAFRLRSSPTGPSGGLASS